MKDNQAKYPQLRFKGFTDPWEKRKLGEHAKYCRGSFPQPYGNKEWYDGEGAMPFVQVVDVTNKLTLVENTKQKISKLAQSKSVFVPKGTVVVTLQGSIGRVAITQYDSFVDRTLLIFEDYEKETDERFWAYTIQKKFEIEKLKAPGGTIKTITKEALSSFDVHLPQFKEQAKIGSFFKQLDDTIALHQRKLAKLKELKQGYLQKMFPKNGAKVPELRFAGFADDWEERKLSEGTSKIGDGLHGTPNYSENGDVFFINGNNLVNGKILISKETKLVTESDQSKDDKLLSTDTILMSINGTIGNLAWYNNERVMLGKSAAYLIVSDFDKKFIFSYLQTSTIKNYFLNNLTGTTIKNLGLKTIRDTTLFVPILEEQRKIGSFFKQLDDTIALHQRKLEKLQELKKGYLQKMFC
ncbi:restriction endonuclease subunit S [Pediococcus pentosaceus]|nr:restriction endonuclease subunit S [Pediococcus pentosaceus]UQB01625.1 restriction endonuclease subunit S [Pediococcus pentosaceus]UQB03479.1 restriction endonuclease subunit S [Pediococcus pentosaceus]